MSVIRQVLEPYFDLDCCSANTIFEARPLAFYQTSHAPAIYVYAKWLYSQQVWVYLPCNRITTL